MATETAIRKARPDDAPRLAEIAVAAYGRYVADIGREPPPMRQDFPAAIAAARCWVLGAPPHGYVVAYGRNDGWLIENVAVLPEAQGTGAGKALLAFAEAEGRRRGHDRAILYTHAKMTRNLALYPALGYAETGRRTEDGLDRVYFEKAL